MISMERARALLDQHLESENLKKHSLATSVIMKKLAEHFGEPGEEWEVIGLLHDLDYDRTRDTPEKHALESVELLRSEGLPENYLHAIASHNEMTGKIRESRLDYALAAAECITGMIIACALVYPDRKISSVKPKSIKKRMKQTAFARNVSREGIMECEKAGISFEEFVPLSLSAMAQIQDQLIS